MKKPSELTNKDIGTKLYNKKDNSEHIFMSRHKDNNDNTYRVLTIINDIESVCYWYIDDPSNVIDGIDNNFTLEKPKEKPIVDWSVIPEWFNWIAMDEDGRWFAYHIIPEIAVMYKVGEGYWKNFDGFWFTESPPEYAPKFNGDWKDSLVERPK
jgi:hypothetical protein